MYNKYTYMMDNHERHRISNCGDDTYYHSYHLWEKLLGSHWESDFPKRQHPSRLHKPVVIAILYTIIIGLGVTLIYSLSKLMRCPDLSQSIYCK